MKNNELSDVYERESRYMNLAKVYCDSSYEKANEIVKLKSEMKDRKMISTALISILPFVTFMIGCIL